MLSPARVQTDHYRLEMKLCVECKNRRPVFFRKGRKHQAKRDKSHRLCMRCYRAVLNRIRNR